MNDIDLTDSNGDGIPDVFENRQPIGEILNEEPPSIPVGRHEGALTLNSHDFSEPVVIIVDKRKDGYRIVEDSEDRLVVFIEPHHA